MARSLSSPALVMLLHLLGTTVVTAAPVRVGATAVDPSHEFFSAIEGHWHGTPVSTPVGPLTQLVNLTVTKTPGVAGQWLMSRGIGYFELRGSAQQFWVNSWGSNATAGNLTYCGLFDGWLEPETPLLQPFPFKRTATSATSMTWEMDFIFPWTSVWTLSIVNNGTELHSKFIMGGANHLEVTHSRVDASSGIAQQAMAAALQVATTSVGRHHHHHEEYDPCTLPNPNPGPGEFSSLPRVPSSKKKKAKLPTTASAMRCPLGYTEKDGPMPEAVKQILEQKSKKKKEQQKLPPNGKEEKKHYDHCYILNEAMSLKLQWNWNTTTNVLDVQVSGARGGGASMASHYVGLGFWPQWPYMRNMDVALGFVVPHTGQPCVQSLYVQDKLSMPTTFGANMTLMNTNAWVSSSGDAAGAGSDDTLTMQFSRPFSTGHHDLAKPQPITYYGLGYEMAFAIGKMEVGGTCSSSYPNYHGPTRGVHSIHWNNASALPEEMKC